MQKTRYDPSTKVLSIWFNPSGDRYDYEGVEPETYAALTAASSKGRYFIESVRDQHRLRFVEQGANEPADLRQPLTK
ncbi:KTSC domain-containing protein [Mesorhizobium dulcispinae]|uniref:KTSC domain-containing protein n=1 Tax=Mesorhizobium dulcispinae TaxID=3072316 RepID=UPI002A24025F|nr:KTSC domain-containing protein [Mesorhizobium sp. VK23D]MDX8518834.1 KTSC domain-containing protein [Mesorhizobium sp. VK23D]